MVADIHNFLKLYVTENGIPLTQMLTPADLQQLSITLAHITISPSTKEFNDIGEDIFIALGKNTHRAITYPIDSIPFSTTLDEETNRADLALLGYYCFQYFAVLYELPIDKILFVVNNFMREHIVKQEDTKLVNCNNPVSNLIPIGENQYIRFDGKTILPPFDSIKEDFIKQINSLLIK